jgi:queuine tRNA-ribosyltransferase
MEPYFKFKIIHQSKKSRARVGQIITPHGVIDTPNFVAVGTNGSLKALDNHLLEKIDQQLIFCNTYHLMLHPGADVVKNAGGLHKFIGRTKPIITDSGGFQVFSLAYGSVKDEIKSKGKKQLNNSVLKISEEGVIFRSYRDGQKVILTPETSVLAQKSLGADIIIPFDELPPYHVDEQKLKRSLLRTHRWEERSLNEHLKNPQQQAMYAVVHGGVNKDFRSLSCKTLSKLAFDGFAIGGSVGKDRAEMVEMLIHTVPQLPTSKPNHLLGIGDIPSIERIVPLGIDTFDSSHPTKCARHGQLFTSLGTRKITQAMFKEQFSPIDPQCECYTCKNYSASYLHHLFKAKEPTAHTLATIHNVTFMAHLMKQYRQRILNGDI